MDKIAAYALISQTSQNTLSTKDMKAKIVELLKAIDAPVMEESLDLFLSNIEGKSYEEIIASGSELMKSQICASSSNASNNTAAGSSAPAAQEQAKEESEESEANLDFF